MSSGDTAGQLGVRRAEEDRAGEQATDTRQYYERESLGETQR